MATNNHSSQRPATTLRCGNIKATSWQNVSEKGPFFATIFSQPFKDQSGIWRNGTPFGLNGLEALMNVAFEAKEWMIAHTEAMRCITHEQSAGHFPCRIRSTFARRVNIYVTPTGCGTTTGGRLR